MHTARSGAGAASINGRIYVVGGQDRAVHYSSMECYDPRENTWTMCPSMKHPRSGVAGQTPPGLLRQKIVERFNVDMQLWEIFVSLTHPRAWPAAMVFHRQIYVVGGYDGQFRLKTIGRLEEGDQKWRRVTDMSEFRAGCGAAVL